MINTLAQTGTAKPYHRKESTCCTNCGSTVAEGGRFTYIHVMITITVNKQTNKQTNRLWA